MMTDRVKQIQNFLIQAGFGWMFDREAEERAQALAEQFNEAEKYYNQRYPTQIDLIATIQFDYAKYLPFLQSIGLPLSTEMRVIILRLVEGAEIRELNLAYHKGQNPVISILLSDDPKNQSVNARGPWDPMILTQLGYTVTEANLEIIGLRPWEMPENTTCQS